LGEANQVGATTDRARRIGFLVTRRGTLSHAENIGRSCENFGEAILQAVKEIPTTGGLSRCRDRA